MSQSELKKLRWQMWRVKWFFHFTRNNPNHTKRFYYRFKSIITTDKWKNISPDIRQAWEDAANRFDIQYGLVKAWAEAYTNPAEFIESYQSKQEGPNQDEKLQSVIDDFEKARKKQEEEIENWGKMEEEINKALLRLYKIKKRMGKKQPEKGGVK